MPTESNIQSQQVGMALCIAKTHTPHKIFEYVHTAFASNSMSWCDNLESHNTQLFKHAAFTIKKVTYFS